MERVMHSSVCVCATTANCIVCQYTLHTHRRKTRSEYVYILATEALVLSFNIQRCCCCRRLSMLPLVPPYVITPQTHTQHFQLRPHISISSAMCFVNQRFLLLLSAAVAAISTRKSDACTLATEVKKKEEKQNREKTKSDTTHTHIHSVTSDILQNSPVDLNVPRDALLCVGCGNVCPLSVYRIRISAIVLLWFLPSAPYHIFACSSLFAIFAIHGANKLFYLSLLFRICLRGYIFFFTPVATIRSKTECFRWNFPIFVLENISFSGNNFPAIAHISLSCLIHSYPMNHHPMAIWSSAAVRFLFVLLLYVRLNGVYITTEQHWTRKY